MTESNNNQSNARRKLHRRLAEQFSYLRANNLRTGQYENEYAFLEEVLTDEIETNESTAEKTERLKVEAALSERAKTIREKTAVRENKASRSDDRTTASTTDHVIGGYRSTSYFLSPSSLCSRISSIVPRHGGYDGETAVGFYGTWNPSKFTDLIAHLETAKQKAGDSASSIINLAGQDVEVLSAGIKSKSKTEKSGGIYYRHILHWDGITLFIHHNPTGRTVQPIRVKHGAEVLLTNSLFAAHAHVLEFLSLLGFEKTDENISRVDAQVMLDVSVSEFVCLILGNRSRYFFAFLLPKVIKNITLLVWMPKTAVSPNLSNELPNSKHC